MEVTKSGDFTIFPAKKEHIGKLFSLLNEAYAIENGDTGVAFKVPGALRYRNESEIESMLDSFLVLSHPQDGIIGCVSLTFDGEVAEFGSFAIDPTKQGKGLGNVLYDEIIARCKKNGVKSVHIYVVNFRTDVLPFYKKRGFKEFGTKAWKDLCCKGDEDTLSRDAHFILLENVL